MYALLGAVIDRISTARALAFNFIVRLRRVIQLPAHMSKLSFLDDPPRDENVTDYDKQHVGLYLRLLDADAHRASWREVVKIVFGIDPASDYARARRVYDNHLARARQIAASGHRDLLFQKGAPRG